MRIACELIGRQVLLPLKPGPKMRINGHSWRVEAFQDETGGLHWWTAVERLDAAELAKQGHSWRYADSVFSGVPMTFHLVEIGYARHGHLHGHLSRIFEHPEISKYKFQHVDGKPLSGWKTKWGQDIRFTPKRWCDILSADHVEPIKHISLKQAESWRIEEFQQQVAAEADRMVKLPLEWRLVPMSREACDRFGGCPHQGLCYGPKDITPAKVGYVPLESLLQTQTGGIR